MESDIKELLKKNLEASERTLHLVEKIHRAALWAKFFSLLKWAIIIGGLVWSYLAIQPYLQQLLGISQQVGSLQDSLPNDFDIGSLLKNFSK
ncbi:MAG: hypothetical protein Q8Q95_03150 [bacterium]|nr:hypothetical protein [bacterium]